MLERTVRHAVVGRKNYYGSQTIDGADVAAALFTVIESCKKHEIYPRSYIRKVIVDNNHGRKTKTPMQMANERHENAAVDSQEPLPTF